MAQLAMVVGTGMKVKSALDKGKADKESAYSEALILDRNATVMRGASQREAHRELHIAEYNKSDALAIAAASGAGVTNENVLTNLAQHEAEGEFRALSRLFTGQEEAIGTERQAANIRAAGDAAYKAGRISAVSSILTSYSGWKSRYGTSNAVASSTIKKYNANQYTNQLNPNPNLPPGYT